MWTIDAMRTSINTNDWAVIRAVELLYAKQTADEKAAQITEEHNNVGFNGVDAPFLSSLGEQIVQWRKTPENQRRYAKPLSVKQIAKARTKVGKYARQLTTIVNGLHAA